MIRMFVRHHVADFGAWKNGYDAFAQARAKFGVRGDAVFQGAPDTSDVTVWHDFDSMDAARSFVESSELRSAMDNAGVVGDPQIWFAERELPH